MGIALAITLVLGVLVVWSLNLVGMPGNWLILAVVLLYATLVPSESAFDIGSGVLIGLLLLAGIGEAVEFLASALGASQAGGSRRGAVLSMIGSVVGAFVGLFAGVAIPVPLLGPVVGALVCASVGALVGAVLGEQWKGQDLDQSMRVGHAAFWGRLVGTVGKILLGAYMVMLVIAGVVF
jgi:uncharacterized protein YqgC (DUF456 family)